MIKAVFVKEVTTFGILHRWQDTRPNGQQGLPEVEQEACKSDGGWERVIIKMENMKENSEMKAVLAKKKSKKRAV